MKALIQGTRVCQIIEDSEWFPVHPSLDWVDCDNTITEQHTYESGSFISNDPPALTLDQEKVNAISVNQEEAGARIASEFGTVAGGFTATSRKLQHRITKNQAEFSALALKVALGTNDPADDSRLAVLGALKDKVFAIQDAENAAAALINAASNQAGIDAVTVNW